MEEKTDSSIPTNDGWLNTITGLAMAGKDKSVSGKVFARQLTEMECEELYAGDDLARKIVERLPDDGMREGIEFNNLDKEYESKLGDYCLEIEMYEKVHEGWITSREYGGAGIFVNFDEPITENNLNYLSKPVNEANIRGIKSLTVFNRYELTPGTYLDSDIRSKNFGLPLSYILSTTGTNITTFTPIHSSRIIRIEGARLPNRLFQKNNYWHDSVLSSIFQKLSNYNQGYQSTATMLLDFRISVIRLKNLFEMVASGNDKVIRERMELIKLQKSILSMILLNEGEEYENVTHSFQGVKDVLEKLDDQLVAASGYPHTILLGESPSGLQSGQSEIRDYYDNVAKEQNKTIRKPMSELFRYIFLSKDGPTGGKIPANYSFSFKPLWQLDETERAKMQLDVAKKDETYIQNGVLDPDEVALSRFGGKEFSLDTKLSPDRIEQLKSDLEGNKNPGGY